jgi:serine/threonine kinase 38
MLSSKDLNFVGYTYKNFELVNDHDVPGMGTLRLSCFFSCRTSYLKLVNLSVATWTAELKKKEKAKRPSVKSLFGML